MNKYEKRLFAKWEALEKSVQGISYTEPEIKTFAKYLGRQIQDMGVGAFMGKYMWVFYLIYLEISHAQNIIGSRAGDFFLKKFETPKKAA